MTKLSTTSALWLGLLFGCIGTEGGNPHEGRDMGAPDGATSSDMLLPGSDSGALDGGHSCDADAGIPAALCGDGVVAEECPCATGEPAAFAETERGRLTTLVGPTSTGGFVALLTRRCSEGCHETRRLSLEVHRTDARGEPLGEPIEVTPSSVGNNGDHAALLVNDSLVLAFADERAGLSGASDVFFARLDLNTGEWLLAPQRVVAAALPILKVWLAPVAGGYAVLYAHTNELTPEHVPGAHLVQIDETDSASEPVRVVSSPDHPGPFVATESGFLLARWQASSFELVPLDATGAEVGPASVWPTESGWGEGPLMVRTGSSYRVAWSDAAGLHSGSADSTGRPVGPPVTLAAGKLHSMVAGADGSTAILWAEHDDCQPHVLGRLVLTWLDVGGNRVQPDQLVVSAEQTAEGRLAGTPTRLVAGYVSDGPSGPTAWTVNACGD
ncbi:MAG: hypothetical protein JJ863_05980 [Deltaproteobacteria bacterium]|nr:hypothetical protein [Deltaproteobacteria bacterium]